MADSNTNFNMNGLTTMGIVNALRTGNPQVDMAIAVCLPFALNFLITHAKKAWEWIVANGFFAAYFRTKGMIKYEHRTITYKCSRNEYGDLLTDTDSYNSALFKAIRLYLHNVVKLKLKDADLDLTQNEDKSTLDCDEFLDDLACSKNTLADTMATYSVIASPPKNEFHRLGKYGESKAVIELKIKEEQHQEESEGENGDRSKSKTKETVLEYHFRSVDGQAIDDFIDKAYKYYIGVLRSNEDNSRHLYELKVNKEENKPHVYTRYRLSEEKTFASLFFRQKDSLLTLVDNFMNRTGRYNIPGYPRKLGLLLHGPPGTGKTSLIKSLAQYTGRSIINVPLTRISTNSELMSIFYDSKKKVEGQYTPATLGFKDVIYVMEDVDAATKIVKRRDGSKTLDSFDDSVQTQQMVQGKSVFQMFLESKNEHCKKLVTKLTEKSDRLKQELQKADTFKSVTRKLAGLAGLGCAGGVGDNPLLKDLVKDAVAAAKKQEEEQKEVDSILGNHAQTLLNMLENAPSVGEDLEEELLTSAPLPITQAPVEQATDSDSDSLDSFLLDFSGASFSNEKKDDKDPKGGPIGPWEKSFSSKKKGSGFGFSSFFKPPPDALNLQGLLNVLDGVVDSPGRIVVMTTNHPEQLDPALIRPGRVDKKLFLGHMSSQDIILMLEHYYQTRLGPEQRNRIDWALAEKPTRPGIQLAPAQVEQMTAEFDSVEELILALEDKARPAIVSPR